MRGLQVHFPIHQGVLRRVVGHVRAVDGISLDLYAGRTLALVGESGCGKTTAGKGLLQLVPTHRRLGALSRPGTHRPEPSPPASLPQGFADRLPGSLSPP
jgi:ABC-type microcin C transport system duplicated ATPase subunit YejF